MKPILVWCPHATDAGSRTHNGYTRGIENVLAQFNVPYEMVGGLDTEGPGDAGFDETGYSVAILPWARTTIASHQSWLNGSRTIPVVASDCHSSTSLVQASGCDTGITARSSGGAAAFETTTPEGISLCWVATSDMFTLDTSPVTAEAVLASSEATANVAIARLIAPSGGSEVYYIPWGAANVWMSRMLIVLQALKLAGVTPRPIPLRIDVDDAAWIPASGVQGLYDFADWLRAKSAVAIMTLGHEDDAPAAEVQACVIANSDVFRCMIHSHTDSPFLDDVTYPDIATKLARHDEQVEFYRAKGYTVYPAGPFGHLNLPLNTSSRIGRRALGVLGVKVLRGGFIGVEYTGEADRTSFVTTKQGGVCYWYRMGTNVGLAIAYTQYTKAEMYTAYLAPGDPIKTAANMMMQGGSVPAGTMLTILSSNRKRIVWCHAGNFADNGTTYDNPGLAWLNILDQMVEFSGGWVKWADDADLEKWAARPMRRVGLGSGAD